MARKYRLIHLPPTFYTEGPAFQALERLESGDSFIYSDEIADVVSP